MEIHRSMTSFQAKDGPIYCDGSCIEGNATHPRAAWTAVQVDGVGKEIKAIWGVLDRQIYQNANVAGHGGQINAIFEAEPKCEFVTDCRTISNAGKKGLTFAASASRPR